MKSILRVIQIQIRGKYQFFHNFVVTTSKPTGNKSKPLKWIWMKDHTSDSCVFMNILSENVYEIKVM